ncbi:MAG: DUF420 domain-containing protein [Terriglobia bacterium]
MTLSSLPAIDAVLNATSAVLLVAGYISIRRKNVLAHKCLMLSAFGCSCAFISGYLWYHAHVGVKHFTGRGVVRPFYFALLGTHTVLAASVPPLVIITLYFALRSRFVRHKKIARWTLPIWLYVSATGVVVYWLLYQIYAAK